MNEKVMIQVHENIKKYRKLNNMTQEKLAAALEMDPQYYAQLERGERNFSLEKIVKICSVLHVNVEDRTLWISHRLKIPERNPRPGSWNVCYL